TAGGRLEGGEEVEDGLGEGQGVAQLDAGLRQVVHAAQLAAAALAELHDHAGVVAGRDDRPVDDRLVDRGDLACGPVAGVGDGDLVAVLHDHPVDHVGRGGDEADAGL